MTCITIAGDLVSYSEYNVAVPLTRPGHCKNCRRKIVFFQEYCYHNGMHFLNAHAAFGLWVEQSLQMIDPKVSLAQWDYMLDAATLGTKWAKRCPSVCLFQGFGLKLFSFVFTRVWAKRFSSRWFSHLHFFLSICSKVWGKNISSACFSFLYFRRT